MAHRVIYIVVYMHSDIHNEDLNINMGPHVSLSQGCISEYSAYMYCTDISFKFLKLFYAYKCFLACLCTTCKPVAQRGWKRILDPTELELQIVVDYYVVSGNQTRSSTRAVKAVDHLFGLR